jgi:hypothetical protein
MAYINDERRENMATGARAVGSERTRGGVDRNEGRTPAQWFSYIFGAVLVLVGLLGFLVDSTFDTGQPLDGDDLFGLFEINGIHNVVHILSGLFLLALAGKRKSAKTGAIAFGVIYGIVALIGLINGKHVLSLFPVNPYDNVLHIVLAATSLAAGLISKANDEDGYARNGGGRAHVPATTTGRSGTTAVEDVDRLGPGR